MTRGSEEEAKGSAKVQIGAGLLCKSAKVISGAGAGTGFGAARCFQVSRGMD
jgi:hypothetical protein